MGLILLIFFFALFDAVARSPSWPSPHHVLHQFVALVVRSRR